jgi:tetrahydromethanopterin S-methyltransferase subunit E
MSSPTPEPPEHVLEFERRAARLVMSRGGYTNNLHEHYGGERHLQLYVPGGINIEAVVKMGNRVETFVRDGIHMPSYILYTSMSVTETGVPFKEVYFKSTIADRVGAFRWDSTLIEKWLPVLMTQMVLEDLADV